jgi:thiol-disulfide isomerase/thioredoxin
MKNMNLKLSSVTILSLAIAASACLASDASKANTYTLQDAQTKKHTNLSSMKGKYKAIYIDCFASWCGPCQMAIPEVIKLNGKLKGKGVAFVGLDMWDTWDPMQKNIKDRGISYRVLHDEAGRAPNNIGGLLGVEGIPTVIILDGKTLKEKGRWVGYDPASIEAQTKALKSLGVATG